MLAGAPHKWGSAAWAGSGLQRTVGQTRTQRPCHVHPLGVLGGGQELLQAQAVVRGGGGTGSAGLSSRGVRSGGASSATGGSCSRVGRGDDSGFQSSVGSSGERAGEGPLAFPGSHTRGHCGRGRPKREPREQRSYSPLGAAGGRWSLLRLLTDTSGVSADAVPTPDSGGAGRGSWGGRSAPGGVC